MGEMLTTTLDLTLTVVLLIAFIVFALAMLGVALRWGPRRGTWAQPAASLRRPGRATALAMYSMAALQLVAGIVAATQIPGVGTGVLLVCAACSGFYVLCAVSYSLAMRVSRPRGAAEH
jgi:hypothetical protein